MTYLLDNWHKFLFAFIVLFGYGIACGFYFQADQVNKTEQALHQLDEQGGIAAAQETGKQHLVRNYGMIIGWCVCIAVVFLIFIGDVRRMVKTFTIIIAASLLVFSSGCGRRPFEPIKLEVIKSNEEAFLLPLTGDQKKQTSSDNEAYLQANLVYGKQVQIPQQWHQKGRYDSEGEWIDAAILIKVDKSPVTREWTADPNSGTSNKNEAVWVMTSDQVEFSTGWTITARIESREDAIKFLHNYPNGSLTSVMDSEIRSKLQAVFGLEVTDLPMDELRKRATPHIEKTTTSVTKFFKDRGISITNLGITGGFVYKDKSIIETMVKVFNAEQQQAIAIAETKAQEQRNKTIADGIKMVADARNYEMEKASNEVYLKLKQLELQKSLLEKWDGKYPLYFIGTGAGNNPNTLLQLPQLEAPKK